jgi:hypothetical protein
MEYEATVDLEKNYLEKSREQAGERKSTADRFTGGVLGRPRKPAPGEAGAPQDAESNAGSQAEPLQSPLLKPGWFKRR